MTQRPFRTFQLRRRRAAPPRRRLHDHMRVYASREMTRSRRWRLHETTLDAVDVAARESTRLVSRRCRSRTGSTARLYALLKLPDMPELRKRAKASGKRGKDWMTAFAFERRDVKTGTIKYADQKREAARLKRVAAEKVVREEKKLAALTAVWKSTSASGAPDNSSLTHFSAMTRPCWPRRAMRNRHRHAIEQAARRWRGGRREDSARTRRKILISTQAVAQPRSDGVGPHGLSRYVLR